MKANLPTIRSTTAASAISGAASSVLVLSIPIIAAALLVWSTSQWKCQNHPVISEIPGRRLIRTDHKNERKTGKTEPSRIRFTHTWIQWLGDKEVDLEARIVEDSPGSPSGNLRIYQENKLIYSDDAGLFPDSIFRLQDGNLAVLWSHADGACSLHVFAYADGKIRQVLSAEAGKMSPEFVYQPKGHIMGEGFQDSKGKWQTRGGPFFQQRIIVPDTEWVEQPKPYLGFGKRDLLPVSADIYTWDSKKGKYKARTNVPWSQRLQNL